VGLAIVAALLLRRRERTSCVKNRMREFRTSGSVSALKMTKEVRAIVAYLERSHGRRLTPQEIHLSLNQARQIGDLDGEPDIPMPPLCGVTWTWARTSERQWLRPS
jgi:hypothetical protein